MAAKSTSGRRHGSGRSSSSTKNRLCFRLWGTISLSTLTTSSSASSVLLSRLVSRFSARWWQMSVRKGEEELRLLSWTRGSSPSSTGLVTCTWSLSAPFSASRLLSVSESTGASLVDGRRVLRRHLTTAHRVRNPAAITSTTVHQPTWT